MTKKNDSTPVSDIPQLLLNLIFIQSSQKQNVFEMGVGKCMVGASQLKMLEVNKHILFRYPWTQHLVCIIYFTFRHSFTECVDIHILNLTADSTQMCYSVNISPIFSVVILTEADFRAI